MGQPLRHARNAEDFLPRSFGASFDRAAQLLDETFQRCLIVRGAEAVGPVACLDTPPPRLTTVGGVRGRRAAQKDSTASATAALISV
jgi:hypothetical protein